jgi:hypothetical protein
MRANKNHAQPGRVISALNSGVSSHEGPQCCKQLDRRQLLLTCLPIQSFSMHLEECKKLQRCRGIELDFLVLTIVNNPDNLLVQFHALIVSQLLLVTQCCHMSTPFTSRTIIPYWYSMPFALNAETGDELTSKGIFCALSVKTNTPDLRKARRIDYLVFTCQFLMNCTSFPYSVPLCSSAALLFKMS